MKKILIYLFCVLIFGCSFNKNEIYKSNKIPVTNDKNEQIIENKDTENINSKILVLDYMNIKYKKIKDYYNYFNNHMVYTPSAVIIEVIDKEYKKIKFIYDYEIPINDDDYKFLISLYPDDTKEQYPYSAELSKIDENIYFAHSNKIIPSIKNKINLISEEKDFYLIENNEKYYIVFDNLEIDDLKEYSNPVYWILND